MSPCESSCERRLLVAHVWVAVCDGKVSNENDERPDTWVPLRTGDIGYTSSPLRGGSVTMPWKECSVMDERLQFVARRLAGETMAELCRGFGISRKTGYKIFDPMKRAALCRLRSRPLGVWIMHSTTREYRGTTVY